IIGILAGAGCYAATKVRARRKWDDSLDVWACHGVGGTIGVLATGAFADPSVNGPAGLVFGGIDLFLKQAGAAVLVAVFAFGVTYVILRIMDRVSPIQVPEGTEGSGLDRGEHGEAAYDCPPPRGPDAPLPFYTRL